MSKNRDGILLVLTDRKDRDWTMLISDWTGYVKPLVRYEITVKKYAVRRQVLIFNQHICLPYKKSWQPENSLQETWKDLNVFIAHYYTPPTLNEITSTVENSEEVSGNIVIMSRDDRCDYVNS